MTSSDLPSCCAGVLCWADGIRHSQPCWGAVTCIDEDLVYDEDGEVRDSYWVHACSGHEEGYGGSYVPKPSET